MDRLGTGREAACRLRGCAIEDRRRGRGERDFTHKVNDEIHFHYSRIHYEKCLVPLFSVHSLIVLGGGKVLYYSTISLIVGTWEQ